MTNTVIPIHTNRRSARLAFISTVAALALALATFAAGAGSATAPEPAMLTQALTGSTGASAAAVLVHSQTSTRAFKWSATYSTGGSLPAAGTPCSTGDLAAGATTYKAIQANGSYRRCV